ncbi:hypothetical protein [Nocardia heshunensis]
MSGQAPGILAFHGDELNRKHSQHSDYSTHLSAAAPQPPGIRTLPQQLGLIAHSTPNLVLYHQRREQRVLDLKTKNDAVVAGLGQHLTAMPEIDQSSVAPIVASVSEV